MNKILKSNLIFWGVILVVASIGANVYYWGTIYQNAQRQYGYNAAVLQIVKSVTDSKGNIINKSVVVDGITLVPQLPPTK